MFSANPLVVKRKCRANIFFQELILRTFKRQNENINRYSIDKYLCEINDVANSDTESSSTNDVCNNPGFVQTNG